MLSFLFLVSAPGGLCGVLGCGCWCAWIGGLVGVALLWVPSPLVILLSFPLGESLLFVDAALMIGWN